MVFHVRSRGPNWVDAVATGWNEAIAYPLRIFRVTPQLCIQDFLLIEKPPQEHRPISPRAHLFAHIENKPGLVIGRGR